MMDKFSYGGLDGARDPFSHLASPPPFGPPPISMAAMAAMAAAGMAGGKAGNGPSTPEEAMAFEMLRKTKGFFPSSQHHHHHQAAGRSAFPGQPAQLPDVVSTLPAFSHRPDQPKLSPLLAAAGVEQHLRFPIDYPFFNFSNMNRSPTSMAGSLMSGLGGQTQAGSAGGERGSNGSAGNGGGSSGKSTSSSQEDRSKFCSENTYSFLMI